MPVGKAFRQSSCGRVLFTNVVLPLRIMLSSIHKTSSLHPSAGRLAERLSNRHFICPVNPVYFSSVIRNALEFCRQLRQGDEAGVASFEIAHDVAQVVGIVHAVAEGQAQDRLVRGLVQRAFDDGLDAVKAVVQVALAPLILATGTTQSLELPLS